MNVVSACSYDYCKFEVGSSDPVEITDWKKLIRAMRISKDVVRRIRTFEGEIFYRLRSYRYSGSVLLSVSDARKLVEEYGIPLEKVFVDKNGHMVNASSDPAF